MFCPLCGTEAFSVVLHESRRDSFGSLLATNMVDIIALLALPPDTSGGLLADLCRRCEAES